MLNQESTNRLTGARCGDPFAVLGMHADAAAKLWLRAMLPGATSVVVIDVATGKRAAELSLRDPAGLWEAVIPRRKNRFDYRLAVQWANGDEGVYADAYAFGPLIPDADLHFFGEGSHLRPYTFLGAHPMAVGDVEGVRFAVWSPNASRVSVIGDFNAWDGRRHPMRSRGGGGVWEIFIPHVAAGDRYKFEIRSREGHVLPAKADPYARAAELRPATASIVAPPLREARPLPAGRAEANARNAPLSIYELHAASWRRHPDGRLYSWDELAALAARLRRRPRLHAHRADAHQRASVRRLVGLSDARPVRSHRTAWRTGRLRAFRRRLPRQRHRRAARLGTRAFPERRTRPGPIRRHRAVRIRRSRAKASTRTGTR